MNDILSNRIDRRVFLKSGSLALASGLASEAVASVTPKLDLKSGVVEKLAVLV